MKDLKDKVLVAVIVVFVSLTMVFIALKIQQRHLKPKIIVKYKYKERVKVVKVPEKVVKQKINRKRFVEWIYKNSFRCSREQAEEIADILLKTRYPLLFAAIIKNESSFNITAYSKSGAIGLMQVLPTKDHLKQLKDAHIINETRDLFNPKNNILAGQYIFLDILRIKNNKINAALSMYVGGNRTYVDNVLRTLGELIIYVKGSAE